MKNLLCKIGLHFFKEEERQGFNLSHFTSFTTLYKCKCGNKKAVFEDYIGDQLIQSKTEFYKQKT